MKKTPVKLLVVEDDPDILNALNIFLGTMGFDVDVMLNGKEIMRNQFVAPDLFIIDKRLPEVDGIEICRYVRSRRNYKDTPVIVMSASPKARQQALEAGASAFISKPFALEELRLLINDALSFKRVLPER